MWFAEPQAEDGKRMKKKKTQPAIQKLRPEEKENNIVRIVRIMILAALLSAVSVLTVRETLGDAVLPIQYCVTAGLAAGICMAGAYRLRKKIPLAGGIWILPWLAVVLYYRPAEWMRGFQWWVNQILSGWNQAYDGGAALYQIENSVRDQKAISLILIFLCTEISWKLAEKNRTVLCAIFCFTLLLLQLLSGSEHVYHCVLLVWMPLVFLLSNGGKQLSKRSLYWQTGILLLALIGSMGMSQEKMKSVTEFRSRVEQEVQEIRYGSQSLPEGDLNQSYRLRKSTEEMMQVQTGQEKTLYLSGYVGGTYDSSSGKWKPLSEADYGNEYSGMFQWLKKQGFDPLTQTADYYQLGEEKQKPEENSLKIHVFGAERKYLYYPFSLAKVKKGRAAEEKDTGLRSRGLLGIRNYELQELSDFRPAELMMAQSWISNPQNEAQQKYLGAESVYRDFVYKQEMKVDENLQELIQKVFWEKYETQQDGIYSALVWIRKVLKNPSFYAKEAGLEEDAADPVSWFLTGQHQGNDMIYASAAVLAFRMHGIPARYVEGYYISDGMIQEAGGQILVTGQNAHAWVEVYFDGIGWLPVDVTPGYYYESVELQQMVSMPDIVRKTAVLENEQSEGEWSAGEGNGQKGSVPEKIVTYTGLILLGVAALLMIVLTTGFVIGELLRVIRSVHWKRIYQRAGMAKRVEMMQKLLYGLLEMRGIKGRLGWQTEQTDQEIAEKITGVEPGMYRKACALLGKSIYGETELESYEERTLQSFLKKIGRIQKKDTICMKVRLRYGIFVR